MKKPKNGKTTLARTTPAQARKAERKLAQVRGCTVAQVRETERKAHARASRRGKRRLRTRKRTGTRCRARCPPARRCAWHAGRQGLKRSLRQSAKTMRRTWQAWRKP